MAVNPAGNGSPDTPHSMPVTTPSFGGTDNWSLQALIEVKASIAGLNASVNSMSDRIKDLNVAQEKNAEKLASIEKKIYAATLIITLVIGVGGYFANKAIDFGIDMAKRTAVAAPQVPPQPQSAAPANQQ